MSKNIQKYLKLPLLVLFFLIIVFIINKIQLNYLNLWVNFLKNFVSIPGCLKLVYAEKLNPDSLNFWLTHNELSRIWLRYREIHLEFQKHWYYPGPVKSAVFYNLSSLIDSKTNPYPLIVSGEPFLPVSGVVKSLYSEPETLYANYSDFGINLYGLMYDLNCSDQVSLFNFENQLSLKNIEESCLFEGFSKYPFGDHFTIRDLLTYFVVETFKEFQILFQKGIFGQDCYNSIQPPPTTTFIASEHLLMFASWAFPQFWIDSFSLLIEINLDLFKVILSSTFFDSFFTFWPAQQLSKTNPPFMTTKPTTRNFISDFLWVEDFLETAKQMASSIYHKKPDGKFSQLTFFRGFVCQENHYDASAGYFYLRKIPIIYLKLLMLNDLDQIIPIIIFPRDQKTVEYIFYSRQRNWFGLRFTPSLPTGSGFEFNFRGAINKLAHEYRHSEKRWINGYNVIIWDTPYSYPNFKEEKDFKSFISGMIKPNLSSDHRILVNRLVNYGRANYFMYTHNDTAMFKAYSNLNSRCAHQAVFKDRIFTIFCDPNWLDAKKCLKIMFKVISHHFTQRDLLDPTKTKKYYISNIMFKKNLKTSFPEVMLTLHEFSSGCGNPNISPIIVTLTMDMPNAEEILNQFEFSYKKMIESRESLLYKIKKFKKIEGVTSSRYTRLKNELFQRTVGGFYMGFESWLEMDPLKRSATFYPSKNLNWTHMDLYKHIDRPIHYRYVVTSDSNKYLKFTDQEMLDKFETSFRLPKLMQEYYGIDSYINLKRAFLSRCSIEYELHFLKREYFFERKFCIKELFHGYRYERHVRQRQVVRNAYTFDQFEERIYKRKKFKRKRHFRNRFGGNKCHIWKDYGF